MKIARPYQEEAADYMAEHNTYLCDDCGLGKTYTALRTIRLMGLASKHNLVICRKSARLQWQQEIEEEMPGVQVIHTSNIPYDFRKYPAWYIAYYDELHPQRLLYPLARTVWDTIIVDEAHKIKNHQAARTKHITNLNGGRRIALSATPVEKHGGELWPILKWLDNEKFPAYWKWVERTFEISAGYYGGLDIGDPIDVEAYRAEILPYIIKRTKKQVAPDLPERIDIEVPIQMSDSETMAWYEMYAQKDVLVKIEDKEFLIENALALHTKLHQLSVMPSLVGLSFQSSKLLWLAEFIEDHPGMRLLVFSRYREVVDVVARDHKAFRVMGGIDESERFKKGEGHILVGTIDAMSESLSLEMADAAIFLDSHWSTIQMRQAVDRIHRMNITEKKFIYYLIASPTDQHVMDVVQEKKDLQSLLLDFVHGK
jgi:SNF2 family DNA or RNA helicase